LRALQAFLHSRRSPFWLAAPTRAWPLSLPRDALDWGWVPTAHFAPPHLVRVAGPSLRCSRVLPGLLLDTPIPLELELGRGSAWAAPEQRCVVIEGDIDKYALGDLLRRQTGGATRFALPSGVDGGTQDEWLVTLRDWLERYCVSVVFAQKGVDSHAKTFLAEKVGLHFVPLYGRRWLGCVMPR